MKQLILLLSLCCYLPLAQAEQKKLYDGYEVHYAAMLTSDLTPDIARLYQIPRSGKRAFLMLNVRKIQEDGSTVSVPAEIQGQVSNLLAQVRQLEWAQITESTSIYSLSHFPVTHKEWGIFSIKIQPEGSSRILPLSFKQQFYTD